MSCVQLVSTQPLEVLPVRSVMTLTSVPLDLQRASPVPPDKRSPPAGPVMNQTTTQQVPARGGKVRMNTQSCITTSAHSAAQRKKESSVGFHLHRSRQGNQVPNLPHNQAANLLHSHLDSLVVSLVGNPRANPQDSQVDNLVDNLVDNPLDSLVANLVTNLVVNQAVSLLRNLPDVQAGSLVDILARNPLDNPVDNHQVSRRGNQQASHLLDHQDNRAISLRHNPPFGQRVRLLWGPLEIHLRSRRHSLLRNQVVNRQGGPAHRRVNHQVVQRPSLQVSRVACLQVNLQASLAPPLANLQASPQKLFTR